VNLDERTRIQYSDALLGGKMDFDSLPDNVKRNIQDYWTKNPEALSPSVTQEELDALNAKRQAAMQRGEGTGPISWALTPLEYVGSKMYWVYSHSVSPVLSSAVLGARRAVYGTGYGEQDDYRDIWDLAHNVSPGQAIWMLGLDNDQLRERGIAPAQIADSEEGKRAKEAYFGTGAAKFATGSADFAVSWYLDPFVIGGKAAGAGRAAAFTKPVTGEVGTARAIGRVVTGKADTFAQAKVGKSNVEKYETKGVFDSMAEAVQKIKDTHGDNAASVIREHFPTVRKSADGDVLARALGEAKDQNEIADILRISVGDVSARERLLQTNPRAAGQLQAAKAQLSALNTNMAALTVDQRAGLPGDLIKGYVDQVTETINQINGQERFVTNAMDAFGTVQSLNYNKLTTSPMVTGRVKFSDTYSRPVRLLRSYSDLRPSNYLDVHESDSYRELDASLRQVKSVDVGTRRQMVSGYINARPDERGAYLNLMEENVVRKLAAKYGVEPDVAKALYSEYAQRRSASQAGVRSYSGAQWKNQQGEFVNAAEISSDGSVVFAHPILASQMANSHVLMDFSLMEKALKNSGKALEDVYRAGGNAASKTKAVADLLDHYWKFAQLARVGYGPRAVADDLMGQVARFGGAMMMARSAEGAARFVRGAWRYSSREADSMRLISAENGMVQAEQRAQALARRIGKEKDPAARQRLQDAHDDARDMYGQFESEIADIHNRRAPSGTLRPTGLGRGFQGPYEGMEGQMFKDLAAGERNASQIFGRTADWHLRTMRSQGDWATISATTANESQHMNAWLRALNDQVANDPLARQALTGASEAELTRWLRGPEGQQHMGRLNLKYLPEDELAGRVKAHVDHLLDPAIPGADILRGALLDGPLKADDLKDVVKLSQRPDVNAEQLRSAFGGDELTKMLDTAIGGFYKVMNQLPSQYLLRHPLFAQMYRQQVQRQIEVLKGQGVERITDEVRQSMETAARKYALSQVRRFSFNMNHETKLAYNLKFFSAFFSAQQESWNRWARIVADKPQTIAHGTQVYGSPIRLGMATDADGNVIDSEGYVVDPVTGEKRLVPKSDMKIGVQIPDYLGGKSLNKFIGADEHAKWEIPMNSLNLVLQSDPVWLPSSGPLVQMAANSYALRAPEAADMFKKLGILPFGPTGSPETTGDWFNMLVPATLKRGASSEDEKYQGTLFKMMQAEDYKYQNGMRSEPPTWSELKERADTFYSFKTLIGFVAPFSVNQQDPYQFFRDEYKNMQAAYGDGAEDAFYQKYGDSLFMFSQSNSKNNTGIKPTKEGWYMSKYYQDLIDTMEDPRYASVIVGSEGEGEYSQGAYYLQSQTAAQTGGRAKQREKLDAKDAWRKAQASLGWQQYTALNADVQAQLIARGLTSFDSKGAKDLKAKRDANISVLTAQYNPDGTENSYYNRAWEQEFSQLDKGMYDRRALDFQKIADDPGLRAKAFDKDGNPGGQRSEIARLGDYLEARRKVTQELYRRDKAGGSDDINAKKNLDLKQMFSYFTNDLIEQDTRFGYLHARWFPTDMGYGR
jgi:hypothetical protein